MKNLKMISISLCILLLLAGCAYPHEKMSKNLVPYREQIQSVQTAVNQFQKDEDGILPIKTKPGDTPIYQKYIIDFTRISPKYMAEPPGNSFESGGVFQYVLVDPEHHPTVKLFDVRLADAIQSLSMRLNSYRQDHGYPPFKERLSADVFTLDYKKLGLKEAPAVMSPYSKKELPLVINSDGDIFADYTPDLYDFLQKYKKTFKKGEDIRRILVEHSDFVPAYSLPYTIDPKTNKPIFLTK
ncbi:hypothetical protein [Bacillus sp. MUM 13]|uniref:hypothetical protein n=1 Tax=Bacillus sp. MUM 13 TaxID=1678001 RepID=UPI0008F5E3CB|nr:hypothetical protein [Bacillus sp. MUM 13]OIK12281.1 hypothetical protein BIV59_09155 [Bacillus sp. MUM 13]